MHKKNVELEVMKSLKVKLVLRTIDYQGIDKKRVSKAIKRLDYADIMAYVFAAVHNLYQEEPSIYKETIESQ